MVTTPLIIRAEIIYEAIFQSNIPTLFQSTADVSAYR